MMIFEKVFWLLIFAGSVTFLIIGLVNNVALYRVLEAVWFIIIGGGHFLWVNLLTDE